jgi:uncharacterized membrane-anchored protein
MLNKVPEVTVYFWLIKVLSTTVGETTADFLSTTLNLGEDKTALLMSGLLIVALFFQFRAPRYVAGTYWITVVLISIVGTLITDNLSDNYNVPLEATAAIFAVALALAFSTWYASERTLSIHTIFTPRREAFYWLAILFTFALGTAAGDLTAMPLNLGFFPSAMLFGGIILVPAIGWWKFGLNPVVGFWAAYVVTRPLGASFADWFGKPHSQTGLGLGDGPVTGVGLLVFAALVAYTTYKRNDIQQPAHRHAHERQPAMHHQPAAAEA